MRLPLLVFSVLSLGTAALAQDPAPAGKIAQITLVHKGTANIRNEAIRAVMAERVGDTYNPAAADKDGRAIKAMGDFNGEVTGVATADPAGGVDLTFTVAENPVVRKIVFNANTPDGQIGVPAMALLGQMDTKVGRVLNTTTLVRDLDKIFNRRTGYLRTQGYIADVDTDINVEPVTGTLTIPVTEAHIALIALTGNQVTKTEDILKLFGSKPGDVLNEKTLMRDLTRVYDMGAFDQVGPYVLEPSDQGQIRVTVPVVEKKPVSAPAVAAVNAAAEDPALVPRLGEVRLEGTVRETLTGQKRFVLWASRTTDSGKPSQDIAPARQETILVRPSTRLHPSSGAAASLGSFQPGDTVIVVGKSLGPGKPLLARLIAAD